MARDRDYDDDHEIMVIRGRSAVGAFLSSMFGGSELEPEDDDEDQADDDAAAATPPRRGRRRDDDEDQADDDEPQDDPRPRRQSHRYFDRPRRRD